MLLFFPKEVITLCIILQSKACVYLFFVLRISLAKIERSVGRACHSSTSFHLLTATLRVLRLNSHEKQPLNIYTKSRLFRSTTPGQKNCGGKAVYWLQALTVLGYSGISLRGLTCHSGIFCFLFIENI